MFYTFEYPSITIPISSNDRLIWNSSMPSCWTWTDFGSKVKQNTARQGNFQATLPVKLVMQCDGGKFCDGTGLNLMGFPGFAPQLQVSLIDSFSQVDVDDTLVIQLTLAPGPYVSNGVVKYRVDDAGVATVDSMQILMGGSFVSNDVSKPALTVATLIASLPKSQVSLANTVPLAVNFTMFSNSGASCPAGYIPEQVPASKGFTGGWRCTGCNTGHKAGLGDLSCAQCPAGTFANVTGSSECQPCPAGSGCGLACPQPGICPAGQYATAGQETCNNCLEGYYQANTGSTACFACADLISGSSSGQASRAASDCVCPVGTLLRSHISNSFICDACPEGMMCPGGAMQALQLPGYYAYVKDDGALVEGADRRLSVTTYQYFVVLCRDRQECPGGPPGTCATGRGGFACNDCIYNHYGLSDGTCAQCTSSIQGPLLFALFFALFLAVCLVFIIKVDLTKQSLSMISIGALGSQLAYAVQSLGAVRQLHVDWVNPIKAIMEVFVLMNFNYNVIDISCIWEHDDPVIRFLLKILTYPACASSLVVAYAISKVIRKPLNINSLLNLNGSLLTLFFITLTLGVLMPFQCQNNPDGSKSMVIEPGLLCFVTKNILHL